MPLSLATSTVSHLQVVSLVQRVLRHLPLVQLYPDLQSEFVLQLLPHEPDVVLDEELELVLVLGLGLGEELTDALGLGEGDGLGEGEGEGEGDGDGDATPPPTVTRTGPLGIAAMSGPPLVTFVVSVRKDSTAVPAAPALPVTSKVKNDVAELESQPVAVKQAVFKARFPTLGSSPVSSTVQVQLVLKAGLSFGSETSMGKAPFPPGLISISTWNPSIVSPFVSSEMLMVLVFPGSRDIWAGVAVMITVPASLAAWFRLSCGWESRIIPRIVPITRTAITPKLMNSCFFVRFCMTYGTNLSVSSVLSAKIAVLAVESS